MQVLSPLGGYGNSGFGHDKHFSEAAQLVYGRSLGLKLQSQVSFYHLPLHLQPYNHGILL